MSGPAGELPDAREISIVPAEGRPAVFVDYDGVLTPIVDRPEDALMSDAMRSVVRDLATRCPVCVVSGRDRSVIYRLMGFDDIVVAGSHGFDIHDPATGTITHDASSGYEDLVATVTRDVERRAGAIAGTLVEPKRASVALHYRHVAEFEHAAVQDLVDGILAEHPDELRVTPGKFVHEIQPRIDWNKGKAVLHLLDVLGLDGDGPDGRPSVPIYLGDDVTDEDAFVALAGRGVGILVIDPADAGGRTTSADAVLPGVDEVGRFLDGLAR